MAEQLSKRDTQKLEEARHLHVNGAYASASKLYERLQRKYPRHPAICSLLGALLVEEGDTVRALPILRRATRKDSQNPDNHYNLGLAHAEAGDHAAATPHYRRAIQLNPKHSKAHYNLGLSLRRLEDHAAAISALREDYALAPSFDTCRLLSKSHAHLEQLDEAIHFARQCVELEGATHDDLDALIFLLCRQLIQASYISPAQEDELLTLAQHAVNLTPASTTALTNLGRAASMLGRFGPAEEPLRKVVQKQPEDASAQALLAISQLSQGKLQAGWHARTVLHRMQKTHSASGVPRWQGELRPGLKLWLTREQGIGDQILYARMLEDLRAADIEVTVVCDQREIDLLARAFPTVQFATELSHAEEAAHDAFTTMGELHLYLRQRLDDIPAPRTYLLANSKLTATLKTRYRELYPEQQMVALAWLSHSGINGAGKSVDLDSLLPVLQLPDRVFVCAQYGAGAEALQQHAQRHGYRVHIDDDLNLTSDLNAAGAQLAACDRRVLTSNASAHLAGALGLHTDVLVGLRPVWHWFEADTYADAGYTPWYKGVRLHRQQHLASWDEAVHSVRAALGGA